MGLTPAPAAPVEEVVGTSRRFRSRDDGGVRRSIGKVS